MVHLGALAWTSDVERCTFKLSRAGCKYILSLAPPSVVYDTDVDRSRVGRSRAKVVPPN